MMVDVGIEDTESNGAVIKVIGVGGGGGNAVKNMAHTIEGVEFICANTDAQALRSITNAKVIQLGFNTTKGLGAGTDPAKGREAADEDRAKIEQMLNGTDMLFITTGMGGGTGTGATPVIAKIAKSMGILTVAVVTKPFDFEGKRRRITAEQGIQELRECVDSLITIPNAKLQELLGKDAALTSAFAKADDVLAGAVRGISDIIKRPGMINVDFADVKAVMSGMGLALMGTGCASGPNRAKEATEAAVMNPLLAGVDLKGAQGFLVNITAGPDLTLGEYSDVGRVIEDYAHDDATVKIGTVVDMNMRDELHVTVVATGLNEATLIDQKSGANHIPVMRANQHQQPHQHHQPHAQTYQETPAYQRQPAPAPAPAPVQHPVHDSGRNRQSSPHVSANNFPPIGHNERHVATVASEPAYATNREPVAPQQHAAQNMDTDYLDIPTFLRMKNQNQ
jgi:cell division protein FtsZ